MGRNLLTYLGWIALLSFFVTGCDPLTVHKVATTFLDGVPSMPPAQEYCGEYHEKKLAEAAEAAKRQEAAQIAAAGSVHPPYKEKKCRNCHDKSTESGLIKPKDQFCFVCHPKIISKYFVHGPASVGSCLECHEPHSSSYPALLKWEKGKVCVACHKEQRLAAGMHDKVTTSGMVCSDCHDPHAGDAKYFLR